MQLSLEQGRTQQQRLFQLPSGRSGPRACAIGQAGEQAPRANAWTHAGGRGESGTSSRWSQGCRQLRLAQLRERTQQCLPGGWRGLRAA